MNAPNARIELCLPLEHGHTGDDDIGACLYYNNYTPYTTTGG